MHTQRTHPATDADLIGQLTRRDQQDLARALAVDIAGGRLGHTGSVLRGILLRQRRLEQGPEVAAC